MESFGSSFERETEEDALFTNPEKLDPHQETDYRPNTDYTQLVTNKINTAIESNPETKGQASFTPQEIDKIVEDQKEKPENLSKIQQHLGVFKECNSWKEVGDKVGKAVIEWQKERMIIGLVVAGVVVAVVEPTPIMEHLVGPALVTVGWEHSKYLKKIVPKELVSKFMRIDPVKALKK